MQGVCCGSGGVCGACQVDDGGRAAAGHESTRKLRIERGQAEVGIKSRIMDQVQQSLLLFL